MTASNPWFLSALLGLILIYHLELITALLNLAQFRKALPASLQALYHAEKLERCQDYHRQCTTLDVIRDTTGLSLLIAFWWSGGFGWLHETSSSFGFNPVWTGVATLGSLMAVQSLLGLPFDLWSTFRIESAFGFNRTTLGTFISDRIKGGILSLLLGVPLLALILWFFETQPWAALYAWLSLTSFSLFMAWISPRFIMPLFLKFEPLPDGHLKRSIFDLAARLHFPITEVSLVDGSRRSTKANAFFAGFGKTKRIALFDTLVDHHSPDEVLAVLAHEIGHNKRRHIPKTLALSLAETALLFACLHFALQSPALYAAFGLTAQPIALGLLFFSIAYKPVAFLLSLLSSKLSRQHEFEADAFAREAMGSHAPLSSALTRLSSDHLAHPQPHPLAVRLHYSHPPLVERLNALQQTHS
jgi:STE24 endopeptidase